MISETAWIDANVVLRFLTGQPAHLHKRAVEIMSRAERGELKLYLRPEILAEVVWVLGSGGYKRTKVDIATVLTDFIGARGLVMDERDLAVEALELMASAGVSYVDALLALSAKRRGDPVATFDDEDFRRLGTKRLGE